MTALSWTECASDTFPQDDTAKVRFLVAVTDIDFDIIVPRNGDTLDSGTVFYPSCRVTNYGNRALNIDVRFKLFFIDTIIHPGGYLCTRNLNLIAGGTTVVTAPVPITAMPGAWLLTVGTVLGGRLLADSSWFWVRGTPWRDVEAVYVLSPFGDVETLAFTPMGRVRNNGSDPASFESFFIIENSGGAVVYEDSVGLMMLDPGESADVCYHGGWISVIGNYTAAESVFMVGDQKPRNDVVRRAFRVVARVSGDVGVTQIVSPPSLVPADSSFTPAAAWKDYSGKTATFNAYFFIYNKRGVRVYSEAIEDVTLSPGIETTLTFASFNPGSDTGHWLARCSTAAGDTNFANDTLDSRFFVACPGIEECQPQATCHKLQATVLQSLPPGAVAFDAMGRRVLNPNAGVYFVAANGERSAVSVRKVVLQR
jgi:hypothetical protein